jgi:PadR family transcriptional regulator PadR
VSNEQLNLLQGTLDLLVLKALSGESRHGYGVVEWVRVTTGGTFEIEDGALYTALHRMRKRGWLDARWGISDAKRRAKFYSLTSKGRAQLRKAAGEWERYTTAVGKIMTAGT